VYLPDLNSPYYAKASSGFGSAKLSMGFTDGMMTAFGQDTDTKVADLITAAGGIPTSLATAAKTRAEAAALQQQASDLPSVGGKLEQVADDMDGLLVVEEGLRVLSLYQSGELKRISGGLRKLAQDMRAPEAAAQRPALIDKAKGPRNDLRAIRPGGSDLSDDGKRVWNQVWVIQASLASVVADLEPQPAEPSTLTLYEVVIDGDGTRLEEVQLVPGLGSGR
jgi:hypothetical protein